MKNAAIICIGNELLNGHSKESNSEYIAGRLLSIGVATVVKCVVSDDVAAIVESMECCSRCADIILSLIHI